MRNALRRLLDWHLRSVLRRHGIPDLPEVRALGRASWFRGFTFGASPGPDRMRDLRAAALSAWADRTREESSSREPGVTGIAPTPEARRKRDQRAGIALKVARLTGRPVKIRFHASPSCGGHLPWSLVGRFPRGAGAVEHDCPDAAWDLTRESRQAKGPRGR